MRRLAPLLALALAACAGGGLTAPGGPVGSLSSSGPATPACGVSGAALGTRVGAAAGYEVYDTAPNSTAPRVHYVTGFADGCPRAVTAALVLFGDLATYETVHYDAHAADTAPTDIAYEQIKSQICGVPVGQPCGAALPTLAQDTVFLTLYPVFGEEANSDLLLNAGEVAAADA